MGSHSLPPTPIPQHSWSLTGPPDALAERGHTAIQPIVPLPEEPVDDFAGMAENGALHFVHPRTPVSSLPERGGRG